jgi:AmmeMemoRadiSam system protein B
MKLSKELNKYLSASEQFEDYQSLKSIIVPHSGLVYGGPVAAKAFINVNPDNYDRVVILGPSHYEYFTGGALTSFEKFESPFGNVNVDTTTIKNLLVDSKNFFHFHKVVMSKSIQLKWKYPF